MLEDNCVLKDQRINLDIQVKLLMVRICNVFMHQFGRAHSKEKLQLIRDKLLSSTSTVEI